MNEASIGKINTILPNFISTELEPCKSIANALHGAMTVQRALAMILRIEIKIKIKIKEDGQNKNQNLNLNLNQKSNTKNQNQKRIKSKSNIENQKIK